MINNVHHLFGLTSRILPCSTVRKISTLPKIRLYAQCDTAKSVKDNDQEPLAKPYHVLTHKNLLAIMRRYTQTNPQHKNEGKLMSVIK